jgi:hypothetical protein
VRTRLTVHRIEAIELGKMMAAIYGCIGLIIGFFVSLAAMFGAFANIAGRSSMMFGIGGMAAFVLLPLLYGTLGFIGGCIVALIYNALAGAVGGVSFQVSMTAPPQPVQTQSWPPPAN